MKVYRKLGFSHIETAEMVTAMNLLLANYHVHYQKLRKFHWNVEGPDFFELHEYFEEEYNAVKLNIDAIAERIRVFDKKPWATLKMYLKKSEIKEVEDELTSYEMAREILNDFEILLSFMMDVSDAAREVGDVSTIDLMTQFIQRMEKRHWMLTAWTKEEKKS